MRLVPLLAATLAAGPALAESHLSEDAAYAEAEFRQCATCHVIRDEDGETIAGRNGRTGPNLYCVVGRQAGTAEDYRYGKDLVAAGEAGLTWDEENLTAYLQDPRGFLQDHLGDRGARSKMTFKVRKDGDRSAEAVASAFAAYLAATCPETADTEAGEEAAAQ
jgi:cytochrome c